MIKKKDAILKNQKQMLYKWYHNKIVDLLKITKKAYYKKYFQENRKLLSLMEWYQWNYILQEKQ